MVRFRWESRLNSRIWATSVIVIALTIAMVTFVALRGVSVLNTPREDYGRHMIRHMRYTFSELTALDSLLTAMNNRKSDHAALVLLEEIADRIYVRLELLSGLKHSPLMDPDSKVAPYAHSLMEKLDRLVEKGPPIDNGDLARVQELSAQLLLATGDFTREVESHVDEVILNQKKQSKDAIYEVGISIALLLFCVLLTFGLFIHNRRMVKQLELSNARDGLTGLLNRRGLTAHLVRWQQANRNHRLAFIVFDLDRFKVINDQFGHEAGDAVLKAAGARLEQTFGELARVARWGGDEFVVTVDIEHMDLSVLEATLERLISEPPTLVLNGQSLPIRFSCGACLMPDDATSVDEAMSRADAALLEAKQRGRGCFLFYRSAMSEKRRQQDQIRAHLREAISEDEFYMEYQPQYSLELNEFNSAEALIRWRCSGLNRLVRPDEFIPIAEESDQIWAIDNFVLNTVCRQMAPWIREDGLVRHMAVNLSPHSFQRLGLAATITRILDSHSLPPSALEIEVTEGVLLSETPQLISNLNDLAVLGVRLSLDDFGTGYSNIAYLARLKPDLLKIDRSFLRESNAERRTCIVEGISQLAATLGAQTLVEGVETAEDLAFVKSVGCEYAQGFLLARPMSARAFHDFISRSRPQRAEQMKGAS